MSDEVVGGSLLEVVEEAEARRVGARGRRPARGGRLRRRRRQGLACGVAEMLLLRPSRGADQRAGSRAAQPLRRRAGEVQVVVGLVGGAHGWYWVLWTPC